MVSKTNLILYGIVFSSFLLLKLLFSYANTEHFIFLLEPTSFIVELFTGQLAQYLPKKGFYYEELNIIINKSCSGYNFWLLCFMILSLLAINQSEKLTHKILFIPALIIGTYLATIWVNASRILFSIKLESVMIQWTTAEYPWLHEAEGAFIYLTYLIIIYLIFNHFLIQKTKQNAKLA